MKRIRLDNRVGINSKSNIKTLLVSQSSTTTTPISLRRNQTTSSSSDSTSSTRSKYSSPSVQSSITSQILSAYSLRDDSSSSKTRRPFTGSDSLAGFKQDPHSSSSSSSHFSFSNQQGKRFTDNRDVYHSVASRNGGDRKKKGKESTSNSSRDYESKKRMNNLMSQDAHPLVMSGMARDEMKPGDFIELRRNGEGQQGILLSGPPSTSASSTSSASCTSNFLVLSTGDLLSFRSVTDLTLRFPGYAPSSLVDLASPTQSEVDEAILSEDPSEENASQLQSSKDQASSSSLDEKKLEARAQLCTLIREIKSCSSRIMLEMETNLRGLLQDSTSELHSMISLSTRKAASLLLPASSSSTSTSSLAALLAAHLLLISDSKRFSVDPSAHRVSNTFHIRSRKEVEDQEKVIDWVREFNSGENGSQGKGRSVLQEFKIKVERIKKWLHQTRNNKIDSNTDRTTSSIKDLSDYALNPPSPSISSPNKSESTLASLKFNQDELTIISFFKDFLGSRRRIQKFEGNPELAILLKYLCDSKLTSNDFPTSILQQEHHSLDSTTTSQDLESYWGSLNHPSKYGFIDNTFHALATQLLKDIGVFKPWENVANLDNFLTLILEAKEPSLSSLRRGKDGRLEIVDGLEEKREDFGDSTVYVIDDESAFELDDGISISKVYDGQEGIVGEASHQSGRYWIHIHVADPTSIIPPDSELAKFARERYSSIYLPERRWSLLPEEIVNGIDGKGGVGLAEMTSSSSSTLAQSQGSRTLTFSALVDLLSSEIGSEEKLEIKDVKVQAGWISNVKKLSYKEVGRILSNASFASTSESSTLSLSEQQVQELRTLHSISRILSLNRSKSSFGVSHQNPASFSFALKDPSGLNAVNPPSSQFSKVYPAISSLPNCWTGFPSFSISIPGDLSQDFSTEHQSTSSAQELVAEFMILAGRISGSFATSRSLPMPFRGQESPSRDQISELQDLFQRKNGKVSYSDFVRTDLDLKAGGHRISAWEHFTMGIPPPSSSSGSLLDNGYIRSTSPLRRYPDLLSHWQLKSQLSSSTSKPLFEARDLSPLLSDFDRLDSKIKSYSRTSERSWFILHLSRLLAFDPKNPILGPHKAMVVLKGVRFSHDLSANVRVRVLGLGIPAECEWGLRESSPKLGDEFMVRVKDTHRTGGIMSLIVERV